MRWASAEGSRRAREKKTDLGLREGEEEKEDGSSLPVERNPARVCEHEARGVRGEEVTDQSRSHPETYSNATKAPTTAQYCSQRSSSGSERGRWARAFHVA